MRATFMYFAVAALAAILGREEQTASVPAYRVDPAWPKPLPNRWIVGAVVGVAVDARDHVWIVHRPSTLQPNETRSIWKAAPPVLEFDSDGNLVSSWGGAGDGYEWPQLEPRGPQREGVEPLDVHGALSLRRKEYFSQIGSKPRRRYISFGQSLASATRKTTYTAWRT